MEPKNNNTSDNFATELLKEVKSSAKRWFVAFLVVLGLWFATIGVFFWYISLPVETTSTVDVDGGDGNTSYIGNDMNGDYIYGESDSNKDDSQGSSNKTAE